MISSRSARLIIVLAFCTQAARSHPPVGDLDPLLLTGTGEAGMWGAREVQLGGLRHRSTDGASLIERSPGAAVVRNGGQTGIAQLRGLSGDRVRVDIDGMHVSPACPNHMDPPLHYASAGSDTHLDIIAGITPVRFGGDSLGGTIRLNRPDPVFAEAGTHLWSGEVSGNYLGSHDGYGFGGELGWASDRLRLDYRGGWNTANDLRFPGGTVRASGYTSQHHEVVVSIPTGNGLLALDAGLTRTRDAGTAALPMDMIEADSWHLGLRHRIEFDSGTLESRVYFHDIDHLMDNFSLRPTPAMRMEAPSTSRDYGLRSELTMPAGDRTFRVGLDLHRNEFDAEQVQVATGRRRDMFADNRRQRLGAFGEWEKQWKPDWTSLVGLRFDYVTSKAGPVSSAFGPPPVAADAATFNAGKRSHNDLLADLVASLRFTPDDSTTYELSLGVKNRAPSLLERYLWTPLSASAGRADGRSYLGNPALDPETSFQLAASVQRRNDRWGWRFTPFYNHVHDYIQGSPIARNDAAGRPVLQFRNFDRVELYGAELEGRFALTDQLSLRGHISYVRGRNLVNGDNLYRIAPLRGLLDLAWQNENWETHLELDWTADQNKVSTFNGETPSPGYALIHLRTAYRLPNGMRVELGIENLLDEYYAPHLGGINRVAASDVAVGQHIPGAGRFGYANLSWAF